MYQQKKEFLINVGYFAIMILLIFLSFKFLFSAFLPFVIAFLIASVVQKPSVFISERIRLKQELCAVLLSVLIFVLLISALFFAGYSFVAKAKEIFSNISNILVDISKIFSDFQAKIFGLFENFSPKINTKAENLVIGFFDDTATRITSFLSKLAENIVKGTPSFLFNTIVTLVATCYISKDFNQLLRFYRNFFGDKIFNKTFRIKEIIKHSVMKFVKGYLILLFLTFAQLLIGFYLIGIEYAAVLAALISIVDLLPVLGTGTILVPWGIVDIILSNSRGFWVIILYVIITILRNFAEPKIIGKQMGINPLFTLISMFLGLKLAGFFGLLVFPIILIVVIEYNKTENDIA